MIDGMVSWIGFSPKDGGEMGAKTSEGAVAS
jgi:hypothetical protein